MTKKKPFKTIEDLVSHEKKILDGMILNPEGLSPIVIFSKNDEVSVMMLRVEREQIQKILAGIKSVDPDWMIFMSEAYMRTVKSIACPDYEHGNLQKSFEMGDPTVQEIVNLQVYMGKEKMMVVFRKENNKLVELHRNSEFSGFLDVGDVSNE